jgi:hypothetical protein
MRRATATISQIWYFNPKGVTNKQNQTLGIWITRLIAGESTNLFRRTNTKILEETNQRNSIDKQNQTLIMNLKIQLSLQRPMQKHTSTRKTESCFWKPYSRSHLIQTTITWYHEIASCFYWRTCKTESSKIVWGQGSEWGHILSLTTKARKLFWTVMCQSAFSGTLNILVNWIIVPPSQEAVLYHFTKPKCPYWHLTGIPNQLTWIMSSAIPEMMSIWHGYV